MVHLLLQTVSGRAPHVRELIEALPTVHSADTVSGAFDLVVTLPRRADADAIVAYCSGLQDVLRVLPCLPVEERTLEAV